MTDNSNAAPERIWTCSHLGEYGSYYPEAVEAEGEHGGMAVEYIRADLVSAQIAAAIKADSNRAVDIKNALFAAVLREIRALTPDDADAALTAMLKAERAKAYERAAVEISGYQAFTRYNKVPLTNEMCAAIRALAQEDE